MSGFASSAGSAVPLTIGIFSGVFRYGIGLVGGGGFDAVPHEPSDALTTKHPFACWLIAEAMRWRPPCLPSRPLVGHLLAPTVRWSCDGGGDALGAEIREDSGGGGACGRGGEARW